MADTDQTAVVRLGPEDAPAGLLLSTEAHWNQNEADWRFFLNRGTVFGVRDNEAGQAWYNACVRLWASWDVDYIKVDDLSEPYHTPEIAMLRRALDQYGPHIVFSTSPGPTPTSRAGDIADKSNLWRISGDFWDRWPKLNEQFDLLAQWQGAGGPGHWPDADMIPLGRIAIRSKLGGDPHWTHFTRDEQLTLISLWSLAPSPLMLGMNLPDNDEWTTALLTNPPAGPANFRARPGGGTMAAGPERWRPCRRRVQPHRPAGEGGICLGTAGQWRQTESARSLAASGHQPGGKVLR